MGGGGRDGGREEGEMEGGRGEQRSRKERIYQGGTCTCADSIFLSRRGCIDYIFLSR